MAVVGVGSMALVIVLSGFNGMEELIRGLYNKFDPDIKIEAKVGKSFMMTDSLRSFLDGQEEILSWSEVVEDNALLRYGDNQIFVRLKGVEDHYVEQAEISSNIISGEFNVGSHKAPRAVIGQGIQYMLGIPRDEEGNFLQLWYPKKDLSRAFITGDGFRRRNVSMAGIFSLEKQYDDKYVFVPIDFAASLMHFGKQRSSIEVIGKAGVSTKKLKKVLEPAFGDSFVLLNSDEQHASLLRAIRIEKLFVFLTFIFILMLASFNIFFSLSMLVIEKRSDIRMLFAMGASERLVRNIFFTSGALIAFFGATSGLVIGLVTVLLQDRFGLVKMGMSTAVVQSFPVKLEWLDLLASGVIIFGITLLACLRPANRAAKLASSLG